MEGYSGDSSSEKKDDKSEKKAGKAAGLGSRTFEFVNKKDAAEKIADSSSLWEKLIPKDGGEKAKAESSPSETKPDKKTETSTAESAEEASDPSVENLTAGEKAEVVKDYVQAKTAELEAGRSDGEDPAEAAAREANIEFLKEIAVDAEAAPERADAESPETAEEQSESEDGPAELAHDEAIELNSYDVSAEEAVEDDDLAQQTSSAAFVQSPVTPLAQQQEAGGSPPNQPPRGSSGPGAFGAGPNFNTAPLGYDPSTAPTTIETNNRSNEGAYFLAGGILGYLLGRRRGRIKTEKRLKLVTNKLEKQIKETRDQVVRQETIVRQQARERYNQMHSADSLAARTETRVRSEAVTNTASAESKPQSLEQQAAAERVQRMNHREVLAAAEKIVIDGTNLRTIYEAKQITEPGLRRITREYLTGGDIKAALKQELQVKEMQYERDPQMRDRLAASYAGVDAAQPQASTEALASLLAQNDTPRSSMHATVTQAAQEDEAAKRRGHQVLISAWAALVVVLVIVAVVLAMR